MTTRSAVVLVVALVCFGSLALAQPADPPLVNWTAPSSWTPPTARAGGQAATAAGKAGSVSATEGTAPLPFVAVSPCRLYDNRASDPPFTGDSTFNTDGQTEQIDFHATTTTPYAANGNPNGCTLPPISTVGAWSLKFTYRTSTASQGYLTAYPGSLTTRPGIGTILGTNTQQTSGAAIVAAGTDADNTIKVYAQYAANTIVIDYNGYFANTPDSGQGLYLYTNNGDYAIVGENDDTTCEGICGIYGSTYSSYDHAFGVGGVNHGTAADSAGTYGTDATGISHTATGHWSAGVRGEGRYGVVGISDTANGYGVVGEHLNSSGTKETMGILGNGYFGAGAYGETFLTTSGSAGVRGGAFGGSGQTYGVSGSTASGSSNSAGVYGTTTAASGKTYNVYPAGVMGDSSVYIGVYGVSQFLGVTGDVVSSSGTWIASGGLGVDNSGTYYGVFSWGNFGGSGNKYFIEPHPLRADASIHYVCLEGPEAGTYFRGRGRFVGHSAVIAVPEDFRLVTDPEGLSIQVTPIGEIAGVAVVSIGLDQIVLKSSGDVEFFYLVHGVRHTQTGLQPIVQDNAFMPRGPDETIPGYLSAGQKQSLIANGTYNEDGTVNMQTAARLGWIKVWHDREEAAKASVEKAAARRAGQGQGH